MGHAEKKTSFYIISKNLRRNWVNYVWQSLVAGLFIFFDLFRVVRADRRRCPGQHRFDVLYGVRPAQQQDRKAAQRHRFACRLHPDRPGLLPYCLGQPGGGHRRRRIRFLHGHNGYGAPAGCGDCPGTGFGFVTCAGLFQRGICPGGSRTMPFFSEFSTRCFSLSGPALESSF